MAASTAKAANCRTPTHSRTLKSRTEWCNCVLRKNCVRKMTKSSKIIMQNPAPKIESWVCDNVWCSTGEPSACLYFGVKYFMDVQGDTAATRLFFHQAVRDVATGVYPLPMGESAQLVAVALQHSVGDYKPRRSARGTGGFDEQACLLGTCRTSDN